MRVDGQTPPFENIRIHVVLCRCWTSEAVQKYCARFVWLGRCPTRPVNISCLQLLRPDRTAFPRQYVLAGAFCEDISDKPLAIGALRPVLPPKADKIEIEWEIGLGSIPPVIDEVLLQNGNDHHAGWVQMVLW